MSINFPDPNVSTEYTYVAENGTSITYTWDGAKWNTAFSSGSADANTRNITLVNALTPDTFMPSPSPGLETLETQEDYNIYVYESVGKIHENVTDIDLSEYAKLDDNEQSITAKEFIGDGSNLTNLPIPIVEGNVLFKGSVETVSALPSVDNAVGDMWHVNTDDSLHAWGEDSAWHEVGASTDVDLSNYYTKLESNQKYMPLDIRTLSTLT